MQQEAGLRLKCLGGRLAWGRLPISLVYRATEWSCYGTICEFNTKLSRTQWHRRTGPPTKLSRTKWVLWDCLRDAFMPPALCIRDPATSADFSRLAPSPNTWSYKGPAHPRRKPHSPTSTLYPPRCIQ